MAVAAAMGLAAGAGGCAGTPEVAGGYPDMRGPTPTAPSALSADDRNQAIEELQKAAEENAAEVR